MTTIIYVLKHPTTNEVRYIGKTSGKINHRYNRHLHDARDNRLHRHVNNWIRSLFKQGLLPVMESIEVVEGDGCREEIKWIAAYREQGTRLCNHTDGGEGTVGVIRTEEYRDKHRKRMAHPDYRAKHFCSVRHLTHTPENIEHAKIIFKESDLQKLMMPIVSKITKETLKTIAERQRAQQRITYTFAPLTHNGTAFLPLDKGQYALIDAEDWDKVKDRSWFINKNGSGIRVRTTLMNGGISTKRNLGSFIAGKGAIRNKGDELDYRKSRYDVKYFPDSGEKMSERSENKKEFTRVLSGGLL